MGPSPPKTGPSPFLCRPRPCSNPRPHGSPWRMGSLGHKQKTPTSSLAFLSMLQLHAKPCLSYPPISPLSQVGVPGLRSTVPSLSGSWLCYFGTM